MSQGKSVTKNPATLAKEAHLKQLNKEKTSLLRKLDRQQVKLAALKEDIIGTQQRNLAQITEKMEAIKNLQADLKELFIKVSKMKGISRAEKRMMKEMAGEVSGNLFEDFDRMTDSGRQDNSQRKGPSEFFSQFAPKPEAAETQDIRKLYLRLATRFHPDKARTPDEQEKLHSLMQRINEAYSKGDIAHLLKIEKDYASLELNTDADTAGLADFLQTQIDKLLKEIELLQAQLDRVTAELSNINRSDIGKLHKLAKSKNNPADEMVAGLDETINSLTKLRDGLQEYLQTGIVPEYIKAEMEPEETMAIDMDDLIEAIIAMEEDERQRKRRNRRR